MLAERYELNFGCNMVTRLANKCILNIEYWTNFAEQLVNWTKNYSTSVLFPKSVIEQMANCPIFDWIGVSWTNCSIISLKSIPKISAKRDACNRICAWQPLWPGRNTKLIVHYHNVQLTYCSNGIVQCSIGHRSVAKLFKCTNAQYVHVQLIIGQLTDCSIGILFQ